jgi:preprotein translocase subunit SecE
VSKITQFIKEARVELAKVNWPTRAETVRYTALVIGLSLAVAAFLGALDYLFEYILKAYILI